MRTMQFESDNSKAANGSFVVSPDALHGELRRRILDLPGVTEREHAGIHEDAFFVERTMFMHIHGRGHCDIRLSREEQGRALAEGKARRHRWAPEAGYVTFIVKDQEDLEPAMDLIRKSHEHFSKARTTLETKDNAVEVKRAASGQFFPGAPASLPAGLPHETRTFKLLIIGATGRTGRELVQQALARGHCVTVFVRSPEHINLKDERLTVIKGSVMDENQLFDALQGHDAVITALGPREVFKPTTMLRDSAAVVTRAMKRSGVKRLVVLSAAAHFPGFPNQIARFVLRNHMRDSLAMEKIVEDSGLDWTIARPPRLTQADSTTYRSREDAPPKFGFSVSRKAVAAFMLDALQHKKHIQKIVGVAK